MADVYVSPGLQKVATGVKNLVTGAGTFNTPSATIVNKNQGQAANSTPFNLPSGMSVPANAKIGVPAKAPEQNVKPPSNALATNQVKVGSTPTNTTMATAKTSTGILPGLAASKTAAPTSTKSIYRVGNDVYDAQTNKKIPNVATLTSVYKGAKEVSAPNNTNKELATELPPIKYTAGGVKTDLNQYNQYVPDVSSSGSLQNLANNASIGEPIIGENANKISALSDKGNSAMTSPSYQKYQETTQSISDLDKQFADQMAAMSSSPMSLEFKQGREQVLKDQYSAQRQALATEANNYLTQNQQTMTGVQNQQAGYQGAGNLGVAGQGLRQGGLATVAGLAQPTYQQYGSAQVARDENGNPISTPVGGNSSANPLSQVSTIAQQVISGQITPQAAQSMGGSVSNWQSILNDEIQKQRPGFNYNVAGGLGSAQGQTAASQSSLVESMKSSYGQAQNVRSQLDDFIKTAIPNTSDINKINEGMQAIANNTSDPRYAILHNYLASLKNIYANILGGGTATVDAQQRADSFVDGTMKSSGIQAVLDAVEQEAQARIAGVPTANGAGIGSNLSQGNTGDTMQAGGHNFIKTANGWVAQ